MLDSFESQNPPCNSLYPPFDEQWGKRHRTPAPSFTCIKKLDSIPMPNESCSILPTIQKLPHSRIRWIRCRSSLEETRQNLFPTPKPIPPKGEKTHRIHDTLRTKGLTLRNRHHRHGCRQIRRGNRVGASRVLRRSR